jgi:hypothetical protein
MSTDWALPPRSVHLSPLAGRGRLASALARSKALGYAWGLWGAVRESVPSGDERMSRRSGHRFADKDMRQRVNLQPFPASPSEDPIQFDREWL